MEVKMFKFFFTLSVYLFLVSGCTTEGTMCKPGETKCSTTSETKLIVCSSDGSRWDLEECVSGVKCADFDDCRDPEFSILTDSLPEGTNANEYEFQIQAIGGEQPYGWQLLEGELPEGIIFFGDGTISGFTNEAGTFPITIRAFDGKEIPDMDKVELDLIINIAPLEIYGEYEYDLMITKVVILPILIPYIPYSTQLTAKGGLRPYFWGEDPPPSGFEDYISTWGLPTELKLTSDGEISGTISDVSSASTIVLPNGTELTGYFLHIGVSDSEKPSSHIQSIMCIPTMPGM
jgi:Putative Ig domain